MPFGQAFWMSRLVGWGVGAITGDAEAARGARTATRWIVGLLTLDVAGLIGDQFTELVTEGVFDEVAEQATEEVTDYTVDQAADKGSAIAGSQVSFGSQKLLRQGLAMSWAMISENPRQVIQTLLAHSAELPAEWQGPLTAALKRSPEEMLNVLQTLRQSDAAKFASLVMRKAQPSFGGYDA